MHIEKLRLHHFRNYEDCVVDFSPQTTIFIGKNGNGKTNILEALFFLVFGKSFRTNKTTHCIQWKKETAILQAKVHFEGEDEKKFEYILNKNQTNIQKIDNIQTKHFDYIGQFHAVVFEPDDLRLIDYEPSNRRRFIDMLLSQTIPQYAYKLAKFHKMLKIRNKLLQNIRDKKAEENEIHFWNQHIIDYGSWIISERLAALDYMRQSSSRYYNNISSNNDKFTIHYKCSFTINNDIRENFRKSLEQKYRYDLQTGSTHIGPHRDDLQFFLNEYEMKNSASRGEYRSAILALKMLEIDFIKMKTHKKALLLLDDVFSELDSIRRKALIDFVQKQQTIITTTDLDHIVKKLPSTKVYAVHEGNITLYGN